ncbi:hypothetical protein B0T16DRAFT_444475 [Cercophora newfieldiana]|uniref:Uncharacterized protein n=1 Tax=Cercophora newfieldiana TaxID=92897 RepID=A0AA39Y9W6_9PEZI|nr:hypothetical protein B0T16DRAFT_444475 [Cercophora newfieldiana]
MPNQRRFHCVGSRYSLFERALSRAAWGAETRKGGLDSCDSTPLPAFIRSIPSVHQRHSRLQLSDPRTITTLLLRPSPRYWDLIARLYSAAAHLEHPPPGGWPQITPDLASPLNLSPEALQLLRHIPYFTEGSPCVLTASRPVNYIAICEDAHATLQETGDRPVQDDDDDPDLDPGYPPQIFPLSKPNGNYGCAILIDTQRGVVTWHNVDEPDAPCVDEDGADYLSDVQGWKIAPAWKIESFFAMAEEQLGRLDWLPHLESHGEEFRELDVYGEPDAEQDKKRIRIMRDAGWPGEGWDAQRAREETIRWCNEEYQNRKLDRK